MKLRISLSTQVLSALLLGAVVGVVLGDLAGHLKIVGDIFVEILRITVIPYIAVSLVTGLGGLRSDEIGRLAVKAGGILLLCWALTILLVALMPLAFPAWPAASFFSMSLVEQPDTPDFLRLFIPSNPFHSLANAVVPAVVVFFALLGIALSGLENKAVVLGPLVALRDALMRITGYIAKLAPLGVFALIANMVGTTDLQDLMRLQVYLGLYALLALVLGLGVLPGLISIFTPLRYRDTMRALWAPLITAFATGSTLVVLPMLSQKCKSLIADTKVFDEKAQEDAHASVQVLLPTFFGFPSAGAVLSLSFVLFAGWFVGSTIQATSYPQLFAAGVPALFGGTLLTIPFLLDLHRLPIDLMQVFISVDVVASRFGSLLSAMHYATIGLIGAFALQKQIYFRWRLLVRHGLISSGLILVVLVGVHAFNTHVVTPAYTQDEALKNLRFLGRPQPATVHSRIPPNLNSATGRPAGLEEIERRGVLRVCFAPSEYPSSFYTRSDPPELVGFDIEMAHRFARSMNLSLEFMPARNEEEAKRLLGNGTCDLYMRSLPIGPRRARVFNLTTALYQSSLGLIVEDHRRREFETWDRMQERGDELRIGVEDSPGALSTMRQRVPDAQLLLIEDMDQQRQILADGYGDRIDAIADMAEEGAAWTLLYPTYSMVAPQPTVFLPVSYAVADESPELLKVFDAWLLHMNGSGEIEALYRHWMLGDATKVDRPPRWSVIRDVLGWVD